jgi:hypothetical protein
MTRTVTLRCAHCQLREPVPVTSVLAREVPGGLDARWPCEGCYSGWWTCGAGDDQDGCRMLLTGVGVTIRRLTLAATRPAPAEQEPDWPTLLGSPPVWSSTRRRPPSIGWLMGMWRRPRADL